MGRLLAITQTKRPLHVEQSVHDFEYKMHIVYSHVEVE